MIVLDTNVVSELFRLRPDSGVVAWVAELRGDVALTTITCAELLAGVARLPEGQRKLTLARGIDAVIERYQGTGALLAFDEQAARAYAHITAERDRVGAPISMADAQIAAICRSNDAICATRNTADFVHTGIQLVNPWGDRSE